MPIETLGQNTSSGLTSARNTLTQALGTQSNRLAEAARDTVASFGAATNEITRSTEPAFQPTLAGDTFLAAADTNIDPVTPIIETLGARTAFTAAARALNVISDVENDLLDILN